MFEYVNVKVPADTALCMYNGDELRVLDALLGPGDRVVASVPTGGLSPFGPYEEADLLFYEGDERFMLEYDFMILGDTARIFRYWKTKA